MNIFESYKRGANKILLICCYCIFLNLSRMRAEARFKTSVNPPDIFISHIMSTDDWQWVDVTKNPYSEDFEILKTDKGIVLSGNILGAILKCRASYPVYWTIDKVEELEPFEGQNLMTYNQRNGSIESDPDSWEYSSILKFWTTFYQFTRNYTCHAIHDDNANIQSSIFIFFEESQNYMLNAGGEFTLGVDAKSTIDSPCGMSTIDDDVEVKLFREEIKISQPFNETEWKQVSQNESIKYDPRTGFTFNVHDLPGLLGSYKCLVLVEDENEKDVVHFDIILESKPKEEINTNERIILKDTAALEINLDRLTMSCCSSSQNRPHFRIVHCTSAAECAIRKNFAVKDKEYLMDAWTYFDSQSVTTKNCTTQYLPYQPIFWARCKGDGVDVLSLYYSSYNASADPFHHSTMYGFPGGMLINPASTQIPSDDLILITQFQIPKTNNDGYHMENMVLDDNTFYSGVEFLFECNYSPFVFAIGTYWEVVWKNGNKQKFVTDFVDDNTYYIHEGRITKKIVIEENMVSISCNPPVWNSSEWKKKVLPIDVKIPIAPHMINLNVEEIYWTVNDTNQQLECLFLGKPAPAILWMKDGKILFDNDKFSKAQENGTSLLTIKLVTHDTHGEYSCTGVNIAGKTTKVFSVFVEENHNIHGLVIAAVVLVGLLVTAVLAFVLWKTNIHHKILQNMRQWTFEESHTST